MSTSMFKTALWLVLPLAGALGFSSGGCAGTTEQQDDEHIGTADQALTAEQCDYFDINGTIQVCHQLGNGAFKILRLNEQACINAHGTHAADYVTSTDPASPLYDPTCQGLGCLPEAAPCDATLPCCEGSSCVDGACVADVVAVTCPCAQFPDWAPPGPPGTVGGCYYQPSTYMQLFTALGNIEASARDYDGYCATPNGNGLYGIGIDAAKACILDVVAFDLAGPAVCADCTAEPSMCGTDMCIHHPSAGEAEWCYY